MTPDIKTIVEGLLMASEQPVSIDRMLTVLSNGDDATVSRDDVKTALASLQEDYDGRGIELVQVASGYRFQVKTDLATWVNRLFDDRPPRYSRALLETLAIVAYRQPITRGEIESIRGVSLASSIFKTLQEREWIRVVGHRDVPGRPALFATTRQFLDYFNLKNLSELPTLAELRDIDDINPDLFNDPQPAAADPGADDDAGEAAEAAAIEMPATPAAN
jgi:segregation and condensation protein B